MAKARVARANNVQDYMPHELELPPKADGTPYRIFRPASEIFAKDSLASALHRPIVVDHPRADVTAANWKELSVGDTGGDVLRDGDVMTVPVMVMDAPAVAKVQTSHPEFSWGYSAEIDMTPGKFGDAEYDGSLKGVRYNHLAMCGRARGGSDLRVTDSLVIIDERPAHLRDQETPKMKITIGDAKDVDLSDGAAVAVAVGALNTTLTDAQGKVTQLTTDLTTATTKLGDAEAKVVTLEQAVKDATVTPAQLRAAGKAFETLVTDAKRLAPTLAITDAMDEPAIRKAAVSAKLGDAAKDFTDAQIETAFATSVALLGDGAQQRPTINGTPVNLGDGRTAVANTRAGWLAAKQNAHRAQPAA